MERKRGGLLGAVLLVSAALTAALFLTPLAVLRLRHTDGAIHSAETGGEQMNQTETGGGQLNETKTGGTDRTDSLPTEEGASSPEEGASTLEDIAAQPKNGITAQDGGADGRRDAGTILRVLDGGQVREMDLGRYLAGVLRGEMPASFETEALKAQAAAARTYTLRMVLDGGKHGGAADICTDYACCQAYKSEDAARRDWGGRADEYEAKIEAAVSATDGEVILYGGEPILAVFHSSSPGLTQEVGQVWGGEKPYLVAVSSPERGDAIPNYYSRAEFTAAEFREKVHASFPAADFSGKMSGWLTDAERNSAGTVERITVGGVSMRGQQLRTALGLRSACFTWEVSDGNLVFYVTGHGHGVGLSQYGANQMAKDGADYREILTHYYTGVTLGPYG